MEYKALLGGPGTGKSYRIKSLLEANPKYGMKTSSTGISALNIGGSTINHALGGYRDLPSLVQKINSGQVADELKSIAARYERIIIDEISMLSGESLDYIFLSVMKHNSTSSNKLGLLVVGDPGQLPPVEGRPFFQAGCWKHFNVEYLTEVKRQSDLEFIQALSLVRKGRVRDALDYFVNNIEFLQTYPDEFMGTVFMGVNKRVDDYNANELAKISGDITYYPAKAEGVQLPEWAYLGDIRLKREAKVMITKNNSQMGYANGDTGTVVEMMPDKVLVKLDRDNSHRLIGSNIVENSDRFNKTIGRKTYIPLRLSYASTIHKCIGQDELLTTQRGLIPIKDIVVGDMVLSHDKNFHPVTHHWATGVKSSLVLTTSRGYKLQASEDHLVLILDGLVHNYARLGNLSPGSVVCLNRNHSLSMSNSDAPPELTRILNSVPILDRPELSRDYLRTLFNSDRSSINIATSSISVYSSNSAFKSELQLVLLSLGIVSTIKPNQLSIDDRLSLFKFKRYIGYSKPEYTEELYKITGRSSELPIPLSEDARYSINSMLESYNQLPLPSEDIDYDDVCSILEQVEDEAGSIDHIVAQTLNNTLSSGYSYDRITSITRGPSIPMYDITVEDTNSFTAGGIIVHNCQSLTLPRGVVYLKDKFIGKVSGGLLVGLSRVTEAKGLKLIGTPTDLVNACYINKESLAEINKYESK